MNGQDHARMAQEADLIDALLYPRLGQSRLMVPRYTPMGWWECDVFRVTKAGYFQEFEVKVTRSDFLEFEVKVTRSDFLEFEVKVTRSDFLADRRKAKPEGWDFQPAGAGWSRVFRPAANKHDLLAAGDTAGPTRFWYVVPETLVDQVRDDLPSWAGLLQVKFSPAGDPYQPKEVVSARQLHRTPVADKVLDHARSVLVYRVWGLHRRLVELERASRIRAAKVEELMANGMVDQPPARKGWW